MLLAVSSAANSNKFSKSPDNKLSSGRRPQDLPELQLTGDGDDGYDADRHFYVPSPRRSKPQEAATTAQCEPQSPRTSISTKRLAACVDGPVSSDASPRRATKPMSSNPNRDGSTFPVQKRHSSRASLSVDDVEDHRRYSDSMIPASTKPILAADHCHDCSMGNIRNFVDDVERHRGGDGQAAGGRAGGSTDALLDADNEDISSSRRSVRFAPVVRVCDPASTITFCNLRQFSASSAPASLGSVRKSSGGGGSSGGSCTLPRLSSGGCVFSGSRSVDGQNVGLDPDLPAIVERYMAHRGRQRQHSGNTNSSTFNEVHRFPPLRHRRT